MAQFKKVDTSFFKDWSNFSRLSIKMFNGNHKPKPVDPTPDEPEDPIIPDEPVVDPDKPVINEETEEVTVELADVTTQDIAEIAETFTEIVTVAAPANEETDKGVFYTIEQKNIIID